VRPFQTPVYTMNTFKAILFVALLGFINYSFSTIKNDDSAAIDLTAMETFNQELCDAYSMGENLVLVTKEGKEIINPNAADLSSLSPTLFSENRVRVTLSGRSDNDLCSTELVVTNESSQIIGNYSVNACSAYGWIFFTESDCFEVALFHDAGLEAPYGNNVNGSVDWTFQFNDHSRISGTYMDMGAANMFKVATPCYTTSETIPLSAVEAKKMAKSRMASYGM